VRGPIGAWLARQDYHYDGWKELDKIAGPIVEQIWYEVSRNTSVVDIPLHDFIETKFLRFEQFTDWR
jgi:hypothetical protein